MDTQTNDRPKRKAIPVRVKREVCERQVYICRRCGSRPVHWKPRCQTHFDHEPSLRLRDVNRAGDDYSPRQFSSDHIDALCPDCHHDKTHGTGATTAGTDVGKIKKERRRARAEKTKPQWASRPMTKRPPSAGNGFPPKGSTPMRKKP